MFNYRLYLSAITACVGGLLFGYDTGFIGAAVQLEAFQRDFGMNTANAANVKGNVVATLQAGCFFGTLMMAVVTSKTGRKWGMAISSTVFVVGAIVQTATTNNLGVIYGGRAISGLGIGGASMLAPLYLSEISPARIRGKLSMIYGFSIFFGIMISYWIDYGCERGLDPKGHNQWRIPVALQLVPGAMLCIGAYFISESPRWLAKVNRREEALRHLSHIRMKPEDDAELLQEFHDICHAIEEEIRVSEGVSLKELISPMYRWRVFIGFSTMICQQLTGTVSLTYYAPLLFTTLGLSSTSSSLFATGVYGIVKSVATMIFLLFFIERVGRRLPLILGALAMMTFMAIVAAIDAAQPPVAGSSSPSSASIAAIVMVYLYCISYAVSWGPLPYTVVSEIYPSRIREYCVSIGVATMWAFNYCISRIVPIAIANIGWRTFLMFSILNAFVAVYSFLVIRETTGISLENMDEVFSSGLFMSPKQWTFRTPKSTVEYPELMELERQLSAKRNAEDAHVENVPRSSASVASTANSERRQ
ncbi:general substrate transporter [Dipodascopsis uninucleata]